MKGASRFNSHVIEDLKRVTEDCAGDVDGMIEGMLRFSNIDPKHAADKAPDVCMLMCVCVLRYVCVHELARVCAYVRIGLYAGVYFVSVISIWSYRDTTVIFF